ncbi:response regulator transcription factor [Catenuloplanes atrovinosus]|uniref:DNA-binding NarL/FixJ family response regulator n=1 Tax=Catenuloplanes atrovinosus TaxID=137266 RepID=A0AAE3YLA0_9ACTN|nr:response regulator transcription factor [Catenuloplanes atrovinosus]MDR7275570.1 DNA-binding NarL/FixJ family response regulator [Catenuloplanes atrovinosus]
MTTTVSVIEQHPLFRQALAGVIDEVPELVRGPLTGSVDEFLAYRAPHGVVVLDTQLPGRGGAGAVLAVAEAGYRPLVLSTQATRTDVQAALAAGARGFLTKSADVPEIAAALRQVASGGQYVSPTLAARLLHAPAPVPAPRTVLTERERQVLALLAHGERDVDIARALTISVRTVRSHLDRIREKTGQRRRSELTRLAIGEGLVHHQGHTAA